MVEITFKAYLGFGLQIPCIDLVITPRSGTGEEGGVDWVEEAEDSDEEDDAGETMSRWGREIDLDDELGTSGG